MKPTHTVRPVT